MAKKVLLVLTGGVMKDGITAVWVNYLEAIRRNPALLGRVQFDVAVMDGMQDPVQVQRLQTLGCGFVKLTDRRRNTVRYFLGLTKALRRGGYDAVHANGSSSIMAIEMLAGVLAGVRSRIAHSHNTFCDSVRAHRLCRPFFHLLCNQRLACGREAGEYLFEGRPFIVVPNGQYLAKFRFDEHLRAEYREKLGLEGKFVLGHVGMFNSQKNHEYLVRVYAELKKLMPQAALYMIGEGRLRKDVEKQARALCLDDVHFAGVVDDVPQRLQAMDMMVFPSRYEGLPNVVLEWQASGLGCLMSDTITKDCVHSALVETMPIESEPSEWAARISEWANTDRDRMRDCEKAVAGLKAAGFDIDDNAITLVQYYDQL